MRRFKPLILATLVAFMPLFLLYQLTSYRAFNQTQAAGRVAQVVLNPAFGHEENAGMGTYEGSWRSDGPDTVVRAAESHVGVAYSNVGLLAASTKMYVHGVWRMDYALAAGAPPTFYRPSSSSCSLNGGEGDGGYQVLSSDGKCWIASAPEGRLDVRVWGALADGMTDSGAIISTALKDFPGTVVIPPTTKGFYVSTPIELTGSLAGVVYRASNNYSSSLSYPGTSWLKCSRNVSPCVKMGVAGSLSSAAQLEDLLIVGTVGPPNAGAIGLQFAGGYNLSTRNIAVINFDTCIEWGPERTYAGIATISYNLNTAMCQTHYFVNDGWPEARVIGGRAGFNGAGDYSASRDFVYITHTTDIGPGGGPNGVWFDDYQFNPGDGGVGCAVRFGGWIGTGGLPIEYRFTNDHFEWHSYTGSDTQGIFCSDSTATGIEQLFVSNMVSATGGLAVPAFNFDPATYIGQAYFMESSWGCSSMTLAPADAPNQGSGVVHFSHNLGCGNVSLTAAKNFSLFSDHNTWDSLAVYGKWDFLSIDNDQYVSVIDKATGHVSWSSPVSQTWSPTLKFGGATTRISQSAVGYITRTPTGGFKAFYSVTLTSVGAAEGQATITGLPKFCAAAPEAAPAQTLLGMTDVGSVITILAEATLYLEQNKHSGLEHLTNRNFSNSSVIAGWVGCGTAR